ncbi:transposase family protein [Streptomyces sp. NPDC057460]|uniref:transposase family protein n=1 Tax=Streptomyces sp. NPDC057460 TaxID=3346141 RepID=UPI0036D1749D
MVLRPEELLFPSVPDVAVLSVDVSNEAILIEARCTMTGSDCAGCGGWSEQVHSSYLRFPADVPSAGKRVRLCLRVRRFVCGNALCERRTFVEQIAGLTRRYGRWTERLRSTLAAVGLALAGRAGARMAGVFGVAVSRSTVLRLVEALPDPEPPVPRVVGVDEYATRKGRCYRRSALHPDPHVGRRLSRGPRPVRRHPRCFQLCWARWRTVPAAVHGATSAAVRDMAARRDDRSRRRGVPPAAADQPFRVGRALCRHPEQTAEPAPTTRTPRLATAWPPGLRLLTCGAGVAKAVRR